MLIVVADNAPMQTFDLPQSTVYLKGIEIDANTTANKEGLCETINHNI